MSMSRFCQTSQFSAPCGGYNEPFLSLGAKYEPQSDNSSTSETEIKQIIASLIICALHQSSEKLQFLKLNSLESQQIPTNEQYNVVETFQEDKGMRKGQLDSSAVYIKYRLLEKDRYFPSNLSPRNGSRGTSLRLAQIVNRVSSKLYLYMIMVNLLKQYLPSIRLHLVVWNYGHEDVQTTKTISQSEPTNKATSGDRKLKDQRVCPDNGEERDESEDRKSKGKPRKKKKVSGETLWACPYFRKDPWRYESCLQIKITKISYLKQHLYRHHDSIQYCVSSDQDHQPAGVPDSHSTSQCYCGHHHPWTEGMNATQKESIANTTARRIPEERKWWKIWEILFPTTDISELQISPFLQNIFVEGMTSMRIRCRDRGSQIAHDLLIDEGIPEQYVRRIEDTFADRMLQRIQSEALSTPCQAESTALRNNIETIRNLTQPPSPEPSLPISSFTFGMVQDLSATPSIADYGYDTGQSQYDSNSGAFIQEDVYEYSSISFWESAHAGSSEGNSLPEP